MREARVLIVEDDQALSEVLLYNLQQAGYRVATAPEGQQALHLAETFRPDLILLDLMLPLVDGIEVCRRLRSRPQTRDALILMLTAKADEADQLRGFSAGADDYVTKPFSVQVLQQRVAALLRRGRGTSQADETVECYDVLVDRVRFRATAGGEPLNLTRSEFRILDALIRQPGRVFTRAELIDAALGSDSMVLERTIDVHIRSLRAKLGPYATRIETVRGVGYRFAEPEPADLSAEMAGNE